MPYKAVVHSLCFDVFCARSKHLLDTLPTQYLSPITTKSTHNPLKDRFYIFQSAPQKPDPSLIESSFSPSIMGRFNLFPRSPTQSPPSTQSQITAYWGINPIDPSSPDFPLSNDAIVTVSVCTTVCEASHVRTISTKQRMPLSKCCEMPWADGMVERDGLSWQAGLHGWEYPRSGSIASTPEDKRKGKWSFSLSR